MEEAGAGAEVEGSLKRRGRGKGPENFPSLNCIQRGVTPASGERNVVAAREQSPELWNSTPLGGFAKQAETRAQGQSGLPGLVGVAREGLLIRDTAGLTPTPKPYKLSVGRQN